MRALVQRTSGANVTIDDNVVGQIGPGLVIFHLCGLWFITRLRLTRERYAEIANTLAEGAGAPPTARRDDQ